MAAKRTTAVGKKDKRKPAAVSAKRAAVVDKKDNRKRERSGDKLMALATIEQIATVLNLTPRMINRHVKEDGMPRVGRGEYDLVKCVHWYIDFLNQRVERAKHGGETEQEARGRLVIAQANMKEIDLARMKAEVITVDDTLREVEDVFRALRAHFLALPKLMTLDLSNLTDVKEIEQYLTNRIHDALSEAAALPERITRIAENQTIDQIEDAAAEAAAEVDGVGVGGQISDAESGSERGIRKVADPSLPTRTDGRGK